MILAKVMTLDKKKQKTLKCCDYCFVQDIDNKYSKNNQFIFISVYGLRKKLTSMHG